HWHLLALGAAGILCLFRLVLVRRYPLSSAERLLAVWIAGIPFLVHGENVPGLSFLPFTPVFGTTLPSVMLVLGACLLSPLKSTRAGESPWRTASLVAALFIVN